MACFLFGILVGGGGVVGGVWLLFRAGGLSREGFARILNGIAIGLMQGRKRQQQPEPPPAAIPVRLLPEVIDIRPSPAQTPADAPARPNLLAQPDGANGRGGRAPGPGSRAKRQRGP